MGLGSNVSVKSVTGTLKFLSEKLAIGTMMVGSGYDVKSDEANTAGYVMYGAGLVYMISDLVQRYAERNGLDNIGQINLLELVSCREAMLDAAISAVGIVVPSVIAHQAIQQDPSKSGDLSSQVALASIAGVASLGYLHWTKALETANAQEKDKLQKKDEKKLRDRIAALEGENAAIKEGANKKDRELEKLRAEKEGLLKENESLKENAVTRFEEDAKSNNEFFPSQSSTSYVQRELDRRNNQNNQNTQRVGK